VLFGGAKGPGKTDCLIADALHLIEHPKYKFLLLRRTFPRLQEIIDRCWQIYPRLGGEYRAGEHRWYFPSGAIGQLGHCQHEDSKRDYHGKEFHYIGFDELTEFTDSQYTFILANVRKAETGLELFVRATTNPGGVGHVWVKERFIDTCKPKSQVEYEAGDGQVRKMFIPETYIDPRSGSSRCFVPATVYDNPSIMVNDPTYVSRLEDLPELERMRLLHGIWDVFHGQAFPELSKRIYGCDPFTIPPEWEKFMSFDWGYSKPFSVGWYAIDYDGRLWRYREWYGTKERVSPNDPLDVGLKMTTIEIARGIMDREKEKIKFRVADPACWSRSIQKGGVQGPPPTEDMAKEGVFFLKGDNNRLSGKMQVHQRFKLEEEIEPTTGEVMEENPRFYAFNDQKHFWRTMTELRLDEKNNEDVDTDQEDHIYDEFRYACMSRPVRPKIVERIPRGTFAAERSRYLRAKKYAQVHGTSMEVAYHRVR
jgi:hypothetical protein